MNGTGRKEGIGRGTFPRHALCFLFPLVGCSRAAAPDVVWVDVARLAPAVAPGRVAASPPSPPQGFPAKPATLPPRPAVRLVAEAGIDGAALAREVEAAQEASLARLRRRLSEVYRREADRFARAQIRALGDPYRHAFDSLYPAYRRKFEAYAEKRAYPFSRLAFVVGPRDPNPDDEPVEAKTPLERLLAKQASEARRRLKLLDDEFDKVVEELLANVEAAGADAKAATYAAIEANRDALNRQALSEATLPLSPRGAQAIQLVLAKRGVAIVPAVPARSVVVPAVPAPPPAPRVESPRALVDARARLLGEARIWAAGLGYRLDPAGRDATSEFVRWKETRAGDSPTSPTPSAAR